MKGVNGNEHGLNGFSHRPKFLELPAEWEAEQRRQTRNKIVIIFLLWLISAALGWVLG
jgi:hypothetical protein